MTELIANKPVVGLVISGSGTVSAILSALSIITPILGFACAVIGIMAGVYTYRIQKYKWEHLQKHGQKPSVLGSISDGVNNITDR